MKRINVLISEEASDILDKYQKENKISTKDGALDSLLLKYKNEKTKSKKN